MSSPVAAAEPVDAKKILLKEERYEINRNVDGLKNNLAEDEKKTIKENEKLKVAQKNPETEPPNVTEPPKVRSTAAGCVSDAEILLVDVSINLLQVTEPIRVEKLSNGMLVLPESVFKELKLIPKDGRIKMSDCSFGYQLNTSSGITYDFNPEKFTLDIRVPIVAFELSVFAKKESIKLKPENNNKGAFTNYQLYATQTKTDDSFSGVLDVTGFNKLGS